MTDYVTEIYKMLKDDLKALDRRVDTIYTLSERAETAGGVPSSTLADAPTAATTGAVSGGDLLFISNGRKAAEGAGAGTGVLAVYNPATDEWLRASDNVAVTV